MSDEDKAKEAPLGFWSLVKSGLAAMFGVQTEANRERDFKERKPGDFIFIGIVLTVGFVLTLVFIVNSVLEAAGAGK